MAQKRGFCKGANAEVIIFLNLWEDAYTGLEYLKGLKCSFQSKCSYFDRKALCPPLTRIQKKYLNHT
jgi:hypothetical protein